MYCTYYVISCNVKVLVSTIVTIISGKIVANQTVDFEQVQWLNFTIRAQDHGSPPRIAELPVFLRIVDVNDNNPVFLQPSYQVLINICGKLLPPKLTLQARSESFWFISVLDTTSVFREMPPFKNSAHLGLKIIDYKRRKKKKSSNINIYDLKCASLVFTVWFLSEDM